MKLHRTLNKAILGLAVLLGSNVVTAHCGHIEVADWPWDSASLMANVDKIILEKGYDCKVEMIPGVTMRTIESMESKGRPDVASELWTNDLPELVAKAIEAGDLFIANHGPISGLGEGWWVPSYTIKAHPELKTVLDIVEHPELFPDTDDPSKGAFFGCPSGWGCELINANLFRAFDMEAKGWKLIDPGSAAGLDSSMNKAIYSNKNWFGYYWTPTPLVGKHEMIKLDYGVPFGGSENWDDCIVKAIADCVDPKPSSWKESEVATVVTAHFKESAGPAVMKYLKKRVFPGPVMNALLADMQDKQINSSDMAAEFLSAHADVWSAWVSKAVAKKIKASIN